jgi:hypothetical protein
MSKQKKFLIIIILVVIIVGFLGFLATKSEIKKTSRLDGFAQCISDSGAKFYGAFWCTHCQSQKKMFSSSSKYLPYIECSTSDGQGQLDICKNAGIEGYPTWTFADGSQLSGELPLNVLSEKTSCLLPEGETTTQ